MSDSREPPDFDPFGDEEVKSESEQKRVFERAFPEFMKRVVERAVHAGIEKLTEAPENLRDLMADLRMPKEAAGYFYEQMDDTKKGVYKVVAKEIRDVLEHVNFADEIADVLTKLSFEINTTIRFVPNQADEDDEDGEDEGEGQEEGEPGDKQKKRSSRIPTPKVVSKVVMKAREVVARASERPPPKE